MGDFRITTGPRRTNTTLISSITLKKPSSSPLVTEIELQKKVPVFFFKYCKIFSSAEAMQTNDDAKFIKKWVQKIVLRSTRNKIILYIFVMVHDFSFSV